MTTKEKDLINVIQKDFWQIWHDLALANATVGNILGDMFEDTYFALSRSLLPDLKNSRK